MKRPQKFTKYILNFSGWGLQLQARGHKKW